MHSNVRHELLQRLHVIKFNVFRRIYFFTGWTNCFTTQIKRKSNIQTKQLCSKQHFNKLKGSTVSEKEDLQSMSHWVNTEKLEMSARFYNLYFSVFTNVLSSAVFFFFFDTFHSYHPAFFFITLYFLFNIQLLLAFPLSPVHFYFLKNNQCFTCIFSNITKCCETIFGLISKFHFGPHGRKVFVHWSSLS